MHLSYKKVKEGWIVTRKLDNKELHSHLNSKGGCLTLIRLIKQNKMPKSDYLKESARRLLTSKEYEKLSTRTKQKYVNVNRGIKRRAI